MNQHLRSALKANELLIGFSRTALLPPISFEVRSGESWAVAGPNGAGKSTLLRTLIGLQAPVGGSFQTPERMGYVPQRMRLDRRAPERVIDVVTTGLHEGLSFLKTRLGKRQRSAVDEALARTQCEDLRKARYSELSEGQKQRVLIARAIVRSPELLVLDEPTSAMDLAAERRVLHLLNELRQDSGIAVLLVSHHLTVVAKFATHLIVLDRDLRSVVTGTLTEAGREPAVRKRYGCLFTDADCYEDLNLSDKEGDDG